MRTLLFFAIILYVVKNTSAQVQFTTYASSANKIKTEDVLTRFSGGIQIPTISPDINDPSSTLSFIEFKEYLQETYPLVHQYLEMKVISNYSLLYRWKGTNELLRPALLISHIDVVPIEEASAHEWEQAPFSGKNDGEYIWGRGTVDVKMSIFAIMEATELLLAENFMPSRTLYFAFGHDEETGGNEGASFIAKYLQEQNIELEYVLDEGGGIGKEVIELVEKPIAFVSIAEKGYMTVELAVNLPGGHSSVPVQQSAINILNKTLYRINKAPVKTEITAPVRLMLNAIGEEVHGIRGMALRKRVFTPLVKGQLKKDHFASTLITNTRAVTIINSGMKENVIPKIAVATINFRLLPGTDSAQILTFLRRSIKDERVTITIKKYSEAAKVSDIKHPAYAVVSSTIQDVFPAVAVIPTLNIAGTDSYHYRNLTDNIFRFVPIELHADEAACIHGVNEKISVANYLKAIEFYYLFLRRSHLMESNNEMVENLK